MKWWLALLAAVNFALFGYFHWFGSPPQGVQPGHEAIRPELMKILPPGQRPATPASPAAALPCYEWGSFSADGLARAQNVLQSRAVPFVVRQTVPQEAVRYWVYIPPFVSLAEAQAKGEELRVRGVQDFFIVLEPQWRHAISLGIFKDERLADVLLQELQGRGVSSAVKGVRNQEGAQSSLLLSNLDATVAGELERLKPDFPGSELKQAACQ